MGLMGFRGFLGFRAFRVWVFKTGVLFWLVR